MVMRKTNIYIQQLLGCMMLGGMLLTTPAMYAAVPENATTENATYALFRMCNEYLLSVYQYAFYFLTLCIGICIWNYDEVSKLFSIRIGGYVGLGILFFIIAQTIRVAKLEAANSQNKETITTIFNSIVSFTAMVFAVIAVIVTLMIGG